MTGWKHIAGIIEFSACRTGWLGVWDALVSCVKNEPRRETNQAMTIEYWVNDKRIGIKKNGEESSGTLYVNGLKIDK